jgi:hypothetical protein
MCEGELSKKDTLVGEEGVLGFHKQQRKPSLCKVCNFSVQDEDHDRKTARNFDIVLLYSILALLASVSRIKRAETHQVKHTEKPKRSPAAAQPSAVFRKPRSQ